MGRRRTLDDGERDDVNDALHNPTKRLHKSPCSPSAAKFLSLREADCSALRRTIPFMEGSASKKAAGKKEKYKNTQLAAAVLELKEP